MLAIVRLVKARRKKAGVREPGQDELVRLIAFNTAVHSGPLLASMVFFLGGGLATAWVLVQTHGNMLSLIGFVCAVPMINQFRHSAKFQWSTGVAAGFPEAMKLFNSDPDKYIDALLLDTEYQKAVSNRPKWLQAKYLKLARLRGPNGQSS